MSAATNSMFMWLHIANQRVLIHRDRLATAILLRLDHPDDARAVRDALEREHGIEHVEALRLTIAAAHCIRHNIEP